MQYFQGLYSEAGIHLEAAKNLIEEVQNTREQELKSHKALESTESATASVQLRSVSVPYDDLLTAVACLEVTAQTLQSSGATDGPAFLSDANAYTAWRFYSAPSVPPSSRTCPHGRCSPSRATPTNLNYAGRAIKSLLNGLMALSQRDAGDVARLVLQGERTVLDTLMHRQTPYIRAFRELGAAIQMFVADITTNCSCFEPAGSYPTPTPSQKKAVDVLKLYHATCYPLFIDSPNEDVRSLDTYHPLLRAQDHTVKRLVYQRRRGRVLDQDNTSSNPQIDPQEALAIHFAQALNLAETVLQDSTPQTRSDNPSDFSPTLPTTTPLLIMAHISGITTESRKRVIELLRHYPQREVFLESTFAAALAELILGQEVSDRHGTLEIEAAAPETALSNKVYGAGVTFNNNNVARVAIQTWDDWLANKPGREEILKW
ncbi:hypothetical protein N0V90_000710 [Kalmusia sp. IMI 367209]|nr:hypothetical protein N0V90_000710 [Kalmusia sp. IMI 367209]